MNIDALFEGIWVMIFLILSLIGFAYRVPIFFVGLIGMFTIATHNFLNEIDYWR